MIISVLRIIAGHGWRVMFCNLLINSSLSITTVLVIYRTETINGVFVDEDVFQALSGNVLGGKVLP